MLHCTGHDLPSPKSCYSSQESSTSNCCFLHYLSWCRWIDWSSRSSWNCTHMLYGIIRINNSNQFLDETLSSSSDQRRGTLWLINVFGNTRHWVEVNIKVWNGKSFHSSSMLSKQIHYSLCIITMERIEQSSHRRLELIKILTFVAPQMAVVPSLLALDSAETIDFSLSLAIPSHFPSISIRHQCQTLLSARCCKATVFSKRTELHHQRWPLAAVFSRVALLQPLRTGSRLYGQPRHTTPYRWQSSANLSDPVWRAHRAPPVVHVSFYLEQLWPFVRRISPRRSRYSEMSVGQISPCWEHFRDFLSFWRWEIHRRIGDARWRSLEDVAWALCRQCWHLSRPSCMRLWWWVRYDPRDCRAVDVISDLREVVSGLR